jgi:Fibrinogen beta and gamma chains, C-terminal globular domain
MKTDLGLNSFSQNLKFAYSILPIETLPKYQDMIEAEGNAKLKRLLSRNYKILFKTYLNCLDIKLDGADVSGDGTYSIDPDGSGPLFAYNVFCDMNTDGGGWTRVGDNHLTNGDFTS